jgi:hypothetical protein
MSGSAGSRFSECFFARCMRGHLFTRGPSRNHDVDSVNAASHGTRSTRRIRSRQTPCSNGTPGHPVARHACTIDPMFRQALVCCARVLLLVATAASVFAQQPRIEAVVNAASFQSGIASGTWMTIAGSGLSTTTQSWGAADFSAAGDLPTSLGGVRVIVNGHPGFPAYVSPTQVNFLSPDDPTEG